MLSSPIWTLKRWLDEHGIQEPIGLSYFGMADPRYYGIRHVKLPGGYLLEPPFGPSSFDASIDSGYVAISITNLQGVYFRPQLRHAWREFLDGAEHVATVGHSIRIYRLPSDRSEGPP